MNMEEKDPEPLYANQDELQRLEISQETPYMVMRSKKHSPTEGCKCSQCTDDPIYEKPTTVDNPEKLEEDRSITPHIYDEPQNVVCSNCPCCIIL